MNQEVRYYVKIDTSDWNNYQKSWLKNKKIEEVIKHKKLGYVVKIYEQDIETIMKSKKIKLTVWPDNDSYNFTEEYNVDKIYKETVTIQEC